MKNLQGQVQYQGGEGLSSPTLSSAVVSSGPSRTFTWAARRHAKFVGKQFPAFAKFFSGDTARLFLCCFVVVSDALVVLGASKLADDAVSIFYSIRFNHLFTAAFGLVLMTNFAYGGGLYSFRQIRRIGFQTVGILIAWAVTIGLLVLLDRVKNGAMVMSPVWVGFWAIGASFGFVTNRAILWFWQTHWERAGRFLSPVAIVAADPETGERLACKLRVANRDEIAVAGIFIAGDGIEGYSSLDDLLIQTGALDVTMAFVAMPWDDSATLRATLAQLGRLPIEVSVWPDLPPSSVPFRHHPTGWTLPAITVLKRPIRGRARIAKRIEDLVLGTASLVAVLPLILIIAALIKVTSPGPVLFRQKRYGFNNRVFSVIKFRTMYKDAANSELVRQATRRDPRVTAIGAVLRRSSLDELPQLLNVLKGDMSLVGPRPHAVAHHHQYDALMEDYAGRHRVKPGITGLAQVNGLRGETDTLEKMRKRVDLDLCYISNWTLMLDIKILLRTVLVVFFQRNAY